MEVLPCSTYKAVWCDLLFLNSSISDKMSLVCTNDKMDDVCVTSPMGFCSALLKLKLCGIGHHHVFCPMLLKNTFSTAGKLTLETKTIFVPDVNMFISGHLITVVYDG